MAHRILGNETEFLEHDQKVLAMFLERNRGYPFSFELDNQSSPRIASKHLHFSTIFNLFISESPRWRRVTLKIGKDGILRLHNIKDRLEHLESLHLSRTDVDYTVPETLTGLFSTAPRLTRLSLEGFATWNFNWPIITFLYLGWYQRKDPVQFPSTLSQMVRLETLIIFLENKTFPSITPVILPSLLSLATDTNSLIQALTTPSLKELYIDSDWLLDHGLALIGALKSFFSRSHCHLRAIKLEKIYASSVIGILSHTPDVRTLYLASIRGTMDDVFGWLNGMDGVETPKLTRLQSLVVYDCPAPAQDKTYKIMDLVAQRKMRVDSVVEKLQKLDIEWFQNSDATEALEIRLRKMCKLHDIQYQETPWSKAVNWNPVHDRSQDPYLHPDYD